MTNSSACSPSAARHHRPGTRARRAGFGLDERVRASVGGLLAILRENPDLTRIGFFQADSAEDLRTNWRA